MYVYGTILDMIGGFSNLADFVLQILFNMFACNGSFFFQNN